MSRLKRSAPYIIALTLLALLVAHVPFFASSEAEAPPAAYRALYDQYVGPSVDKVYQAGQAGLSGWTGGLTGSGGGGAKSGDVWGATCDRCMVNPEICGKFGRYVHVYLDVGPMWNLRGAAGLPRDKQRQYHMGRR